MRALMLFIYISLRATSAHADPGFLHIAFPAITAAAHNSISSVFEVHRFDPNSRMTLNLEEFGDSYVQKVKEDHLQPRMEKLVLRQLQQCRERNQLKNCELYGSTLHASGFLMENGRTLLTTLPIETRETPFAIFNMKNELVYMGHADSEPISPGTSVFSAPALRIHLDAVLGTPLRAAARPAAPGTDVFAIGFPAGTGKYTHKTKYPDYGLESRNPLPESKGDGIFYSLGKVVSADANGTFISDADMVTGSEGGPILNAAGEVLGIVMCANYSHNKEGALQVQQYGLSLRALSLLSLFENGDEQRD